ncbi:hypothetical protein [uncultured Lutibacter sp.]|uniref:hypothetical protein n=1 Tax=uncultured Lutibacter sp. TaxID=437739 RepID=UPI00262A5C21|nr:hypothetical protein [uncultured Lutibacter sp.]
MNLIKHNIKFKFDSSLGILFKYHYGLITIEDIKSSWLYAFENNIIPKENKGFILDFRNSKFNIKLSEHAEIADFYKNNLDVFGNFKIAIITDKPKDIVVPILVQYLDDGYTSCPFSTPEAAINWILS